MHITNSSEKLDIEKRKDKFGLHVVTAERIEIHRERRGFEFLDWVGAQNLNSKSQQHI